MARAPAPASAYDDLTARAGSAAPAAVASADPDAAAAAADDAARFCAFVTRASAAATALVAASFLTAAIIKGFEWVMLGSGKACFGFGSILFRTRCALGGESPSSVSTERGLFSFSCPVRGRFVIGSGSEQWFGLEEEGGACVNERVLSRSADCSNVIDLLLWKPFVKANVHSSMVFSNGLE